MGLLKGQETTQIDGDKVTELLKEQESLVYELLDTTSINRVVTKHNLPCLIGGSIKKAYFELLSDYKDHKIVNIDCKKATKADAYGWMVSLAKAVKENQKLIVIIEDIAELPTEMPSDDRLYIENLLGHSWKNKRVTFGEHEIDTTVLPVILTATPEYADQLGQMFRTDSYSWISDFDEEWEAIQHKLSEIK